MLWAYCRVIRCHPQALVVGRRRLATTTGSGILKIEKHIQEALAYGKPVVALESTIVAHGMPYPENLELAQAVESILRAKGVVPATIAVKDGICRVGLASEELEDLAKSGQEGRAQKCSTRDLPLLLAASGEKRGDNSCPQWGATTVASTMKIAHLAGISTFVTGGIGGVHRSGEVTMDVSADLTELASTPVVVVSAGIKSILDIQRTLEVLETNSVPTYGWQTDDFPAFFSPKSGVACPKRVDSPQQIANAYWACRSLQLSQGMLLAVPNHDPAGQNVEDAIQSALQEAADLNILGQDVTPFVLKKVAEQTQGESLKSNIALVKRNAEIGANIAIAIASAATTNNNKLTATKSIHNPVQQIRSASGSQHNVGILRRSHELRMSPMSPNQPMRSEILNHANILVMDGGTEVVKRLDTAKEAAKKGVDICFIPSGVKCAIEAFRQSKFLPCVKYAIVDVEELLAIADGWTDSREDIEFALRESDLQSIKAGAKNTLAKMHETEAHVLITLEDKGLLLASRYGHHKITFSDFPRKNGIEFYKGTAASDSLCGAFLHELLMGRDTLTAATEGFHAVETLLTSGQSIYPLLSQYEATC